MQKFSEFICKHKKSIFIISIVFFIISVIGAKLTNVNYDILVYLPDDIKTIEGQNILTNDFEIGSYAVAIAEDLNNNEIITLENKIKDIKGVGNVVSIYDAIGTNIPIEILPTELRNKVHQENTDIIFITFKESTSSPITLNAVKEIRNLSHHTIKQGGMSSMVLDTMELSKKEIFIYVLIAVVLCIIILELTLDSYVLPFILLGNIGLAIIYNLGTNIFLGDISYITKSLVAVLQLGVTTDFSIFLYHSYERKKNELKDKNKAMQEAIKETFTSVVGSSLTTIIGFLVLCTMTLTLGKDLGIVMAKGVLLGVITVLTIFPSLLLIFDNVIEKTKHKKINFNFEKLNNLIIKYNKVFLIIFLLLLFPFFKANNKIEVYYKLDKSLPSTLESIEANEILKEKYNIVSPEIILIDSKIPDNKLNELTNKIEQVDGIDFVLSLSKLNDLGIDKSILPKEIIDIIKKENYQIMLVNSTYDIATNELNNQIETVNNLINEYDKNAILAGEGPLMKDMINISDTDFKNVNYSSIFCIFIVLFFVLKSFTLPLLLIIVIEFAIFVNLGISYFNGATLPFIAPIVLGTIQLGATIDYAILISTTYLKERFKGTDKVSAITTTINSCAPSVFLSAMCFFLSTFGVGIYSKIEMIASLCFLISRGALISMFVVILVLPSVLLTFDKLIIKTTKKGKYEMKENNKKINTNKVITTILIISLLCSPLLEAIPVYASNNNIYTRLTPNGDIKEHITTNEDNKISTTITYKLDNKEIDIKDLIGKKGHIEISIKYNNKEQTKVNINGKQETIYKPYITLFATSLPNEFNKNIKINNGNTSDNGINTSIIGITSPGIDKSLNNNKLNKYTTIKINYDTDKFELPNIYNLTIPVNVENINFNSLDTLYNSIDKLKSNMNTINTGSKELASATNKLHQELDKQVKLLKNKNVTKEEINTIKESVRAQISKQFNNEYTNIIANKAWASTKKELINSKDPTIPTKVKNHVTSLLLAYLGNKENLGYYAACTSGNTNACNLLVSKGYKIEDINNFRATAIKECTNLATETTMYVGEKVSKEVAVAVSKETAFTISDMLTETLVPLIFNQVKQTVIPSLNTLNTNINKLNIATNTLNDGITKYNKEGITILYNKKNKMKNTTTKINKLLHINKDSNNYIEVIDSIKVPTKEKEVKVEKTKPTLWKRIKELFK